MIIYIYVKKARQRSIVWNCSYFLVNVLAMHFHWYGTVWWFDMPMHFVGGAWIVFCILFSIYKPSCIWSYSENTFISISFGMIATTVLVGGIWELFEFSVDAITLADLANPIDSISDMFLIRQGRFRSIMRCVSFEECDRIKAYGTRYTQGLILWWNRICHRCEFLLELPKLILIQGKSFD